MVHIALHGCETAKSFVQNDEYLYDIVPKNWGYLEWAALNDMIVIFPQVKQTNTNSRACWDTSGYTDDNWFTNQGAQTQALKKMIERVNTANPNPTGRSEADWIHDPFGND